MLKPIPLFSTKNSESLTDNKENDNIFVSVVKQNIDAKIKDDDKSSSKNLESINSPIKIAENQSPPYKFDLKIPQDIVSSPQNDSRHNATPVYSNNSNSKNDMKKQSFEFMYHNLQQILQKVKHHDKWANEQDTIYLKVDDNNREETKDTEQNQSFGWSSMEIVKSIRLSPKNTNYPSVEVLHFKRMGEDNSDSKPNPVKFKQSIPTSVVNGISNEDVTQPVVPKKLSFNSVSSMSTPVKEHDGLKQKMNSLLFQLQTSSQGKYLFGSSTNSNENSEAKPKSDPPVNFISKPKQAVTSHKLQPKMCKEYGPKGTFWKSYIFY